jgi:hypothetical protein
MSLSEIQLLLGAWREAERAREGYDPDGAEFTARDEIARDAREEYLEIVRERAGRHRYAAGFRTIQADIQELDEAEERRASSDRHSPEYRQAALDVHDRNDRIVIQIRADDADADEAGIPFDRLNVSSRDAVGSGR